MFPEDLRAEMERAGVWRAFHLCRIRLRDGGMRPVEARIRSLRRYYPRGLAWFPKWAALFPGGCG